MRTVRTPIEIKAAPEVVWNLIVDTERYNTWNPIYEYLRGNMFPGGYVELQMDLDLDGIADYIEDQNIKEQMQGGHHVNTRQKQVFKIIELIEPEYLKWEMKKFAGFFLHHIQTFELDRTPEGYTNFTFVQEVGGFLGNMMPGNYYYNYFKGFNTYFNQALKKAAENPDSIFQ